MCFVVFINSNQLSRWASSPDNIDFNFSSGVHGVGNLAILFFPLTSSLLQAPIQAGLVPDCVEESLYFANI